MKKVLSILILITLILSCEKNNSEEAQTETLNFTGPVESCSDFGIRQFLDAKNFTTSLTIVGSGREKLDLTSEFKMFNLSNDGIDMTISEWNETAYDVMCNDVPPATLVETDSFKAISGDIRIMITEIENMGSETFYKITVELSNVVFESSDGANKIISNLIIENAGVGWLPG